MDKEAFQKLSTSDKIFWRCFGPMGIIGLLGITVFLVTIAARALPWGMPLKAVVVTVILASAVGIFLKVSPISEKLYPEDE